HEERTRVAVPVDARRAATVVTIRTRMRFELAELAECESAVAQVEQRRRGARQLSRGGVVAADDRQSKQSIFFGLGTIEKTVATSLALRGVGSRILSGRDRIATEAQTRELQVAAIAANRDGVRTERFDAIDAVSERHRIDGALLRIAHCIELGIGRARLRP